MKDLPNKILKPAVIVDMFALIRKLQQVPELVTISHSIFKEVEHLIANKELRNDSYCNYTLGDLSTTDKQSEIDMFLESTGFTKNDNILLNISW